jgi:glucan phosphorylase
VEDFYVLGRFPATATANDKYLALAYSVRDRLLEHWVRTSETYYRKKVRTVCYFSAEFLLGPHLRNNLINLGTFDTAKQAMEELGLGPVGCQTSGPHEARIRIYRRQTTPCDQTDDLVA